MNPARGEARLRLGADELLVRPTFTALVAAEEELGPLFALVERAADGRLGLHELVALLWHCVERPADLARDAFAEALVAAGLAQLTPILRLLLRQILQGR
jgi:hypothetical protein